MKCMVRWSDLIIENPVITLLPNPHRTVVAVKSKITLSSLLKEVILQGDQSIKALSVNAECEYLNVVPTAPRLEQYKDKLWTSGRWIHHYLRKEHIY